MMTVADVSDLAELIIGRRDALPNCGAQENFFATPAGSVEDVHQTRDFP
jgi:hypothetical protein